ncbi:hypothetical protein Tco_0899511 [Tanacetum coccineum]
MMLVEALELGTVLDEEHMAFLADNGDIVTTAPIASAVLMAKLSAYDSDVLSKVPTYDTYLDNHVIDQSVQEMQYSEQPLFTNDPDIDITNDNTPSSAQQDSMIMSVIEEMSNQVGKCNEVNEENKTVYESLTDELERYKEQIKFFEERQKFDLNDKEKYIDGQLREVIFDRNAKVAYFQNQIHKLKLQLSATVKSHKNLSTTIDVLKKESKAKEDKYLEEIINLEKKKKALDNVVYKMGQSTQTMNMLTKPQVFYNESHKTTLGYQKPSNSSQTKVTSLYCSHTIVKLYDALFVMDIEETLILAEERVASYVSATCPSSRKQSEKLIAVTPIKKQERVITSTSASGSKPSGNTKKNRISRPTSSNKKNKVEDHLRSVKSSLNKTNRVSEPVCNANVKHSVLNANSMLICSTCNECVKVRISSQRFGILCSIVRSGLVYCSGGLSGKYTVLAVCQIVHCASGLSFLTAVCLIRQRFLKTISHSNLGNKPLPISFLGSGLVLLLHSGLPYSLVAVLQFNFVAIRIGSELTKEDCESHLYDDFKHFHLYKGETIHDYYVRFSKLINDMRNIKMTMSKMQLNSKFINNMLPEWGRFIIAVILNRGLRDSNYDQLYAYLKQHESHSNENKMMLERFTQPNVDPLALMSNVLHQ